MKTLKIKVNDEEHELYYWYGWVGPYMLYVLTSANDETISIYSQSFDTALEEMIYELSEPQYLH